MPGPAELLPRHTRRPDSKAVSRGKLHGYAVLLCIGQISGGAFAQALSLAPSAMPQLT